MSIGLYDDDFLTSPTRFFKLEILKLSQYYKRKHEIVVMRPIFEPERHKLNYFYKDEMDNSLSTLLTLPNVIYGGKAFNDGVYVALPNEIEYNKPDTLIYDRFIRECKKNPIYGVQANNRWREQLNGQHFRLSLDGQNLWKDYAIQIQDKTRNGSTYIHDYDLAQVNGWRDACLAYHERFPFSKITLTYPITCNSIDEALYFKNNDYFTQDMTLHFDHFPSCREILELSKLRFPLEFAPLPSRYDENEFTTKYLPEIFYKGLFCKIHCKSFSLIYRDDFFIDNREAKELMFVISMFIKSHKTMKMTENHLKRDTLMKYIQRSATVNSLMFSWEHVKELLEWLSLRNNSLAKELKYMTYQNALMEGIYDI